MPIDYGTAREVLDHAFAKAARRFLENAPPAVSGDLTEAFDIIFASSTQAYREVLVGCTVARIQDRTINIRLPYVAQGPNAFSGRTLDQRVVNPFLHENRIPSSRGPYLSTFRRSVRFDGTTRSGWRDKLGYDALLRLVGYLEANSEDAVLEAFLGYLLFRFVMLREASQVPLARVQRISLEQYNALISGLLQTPSGGRFPVLLVVAAFRSIGEFFELDWTVEYQGINVSDAAAGAGGDVTVIRGGRVLLAVEVTERPVDRTRVVATFNTKIAPRGIEDYLFFTPLVSLSDEARTQARQYFAQGHELNFLEIKDWILMSLATMGMRGRAVFSRALLELLDTPEMPASVRMAWNTQVARLLES